ncbi:MAG: tryptophan synthase subunit alpha [Thermaerobacter sp.]|nr:tryptophan synthase subunit alpha [Thermaerobacter sp.]
MTRLQEALQGLRQEGRAALMAYLCAGDPTIEASVEGLVAAAQAGADILEIGWPFSDPVADGPVIQAASERALRHTRRVDVISAVAALRARVAQPIAVLSYCNPLISSGRDETLRELAQAGADALVIPDLPLEESAPWREAAAALGLSITPFIAPTTDPQRLPQIAQAADGFVYAVALLGVTGAAEDKAESILPVVAALRRHKDVPVLAGFGIGDAAAAARWRSRGLDGVIVGSALVKAMAQEGAEGVRNLVRQIRAGLDNLG